LNHSVNPNGAQRVNQGKAPRWRDDWGIRLD